MRIKQKMVHTAYHFFSEGIIFILLLGPFFHYTYGEVPYWTGLFSLIIVTIVFSILAQFSERVIWYLLVAPIIGVGYYFILDFTLFLTVVVVSVFTWRYIVLRQDSDLENENKYLLATTFLVIIYVLIARENSAVVYLLIQFFTLMIGYLMNHTVAVPHHQKKQMTLGLGKLFLPLILLLVASIGLLHLFGVPALFMLWDVIIVNLWEGIVLVVAYIGVGLMYGLQFLINLLPMSDEKQSESNAGEIGMDEEEFIVNPSDEAIGVNIGWIFTVLLLAFILYQAFKIYRKRFEQEEGQVVASVTHTPLTDKRESRETMMTRLRQRFFSRRSDPIRKVMYQFEREAEKRQQGRRSFETVSEWFARIGVRANIDTYKKVRYGGEQASSMEVKQLSEQLKDWFSK